MLSGQPIIILKENVERNYGKRSPALEYCGSKGNCRCRQVHAWSPGHGQDACQFDRATSSSPTTARPSLSEIAVQHPGAKMVIEVARTQDDEVGDGTTTAVILVGALMEQAESMLEQGIHPTVIAQGYRMGMEKALEIINGLSLKVDPSDRKTLLKIADTAITGKSIESGQGQARRHHRRCGHDRCREGRTARYTRGRRRRHDQEAEGRRPWTMPS